MDNPQLKFPNPENRFTVVLAYGSYEIAVHEIINVFRVHGFCEAPRMVCV